MVPDQEAQDCDALKIHATAMNKLSDAGNQCLRIQARNNQRCCTLFAKVLDNYENNIMRGRFIDCKPARSQTAVAAAASDASWAEAGWTQAASSWDAKGWSEADWSESSWSETDWSDHASARVTRRHERCCGLQANSFYVCAFPDD